MKLLNAGFVSLAVCFPVRSLQTESQQNSHKNIPMGQVTDMSSDTVPISDNLDTVLNC